MTPVFQAVEIATGITKEQLCSDAKRQEILFARYIAIQLLREQHATMETIAQEMKRTRQGISKSLRAHQDLLNSDYYYRNTFSTAKMLVSLPMTSLPPKRMHRPVQFAFSFVAS